MYRYTVDENGEGRGFASQTVTKRTGDEYTHSLAVEMDEPLRKAYVVATPKAGGVFTKHYRETMGSEAPIECTWSTPLTVLPARTHNGTRWTTHATCDFQHRGRAGRYTRDETGSVTRRETITIAGRQHEAFVVRVEGKNRTTGTDDSQRTYVLEYAVTPAGVVGWSVETGQSSVVGNAPIAKWTRTMRLIEARPGEP